MILSRAKDEPWRAISRVVFSLPLNSKLAARVNLLPNRMKLLHQIIGISAVVIFLLTGQYLEFYYPHMEGVTDGVRMMFRSRHIYILLAGLLNIGIGVYFNYHKKRWRRILQLTGSSLVLVAPLLLIAAFFYEPTHGHLQRPFTLPAIVALLSGTLLHMLGAMRQSAESVIKSTS